MNVRQGAICWGLGLVTLLATTMSSGQVSTIPTTVEEQPQDADATKLTMQSKLQQSQRITAGLVRRDFDTLVEAAELLKQLSLSPPPQLSRAGDDSDAAVYEHFRLEFARLVGQLERQARRQEPEATAYIHQNLTATCIACHDYIRDYP